MRKILFLSTFAAAVALAGGTASADTAVAVQPFHDITIEGMGHVTFVHGAQQRVVLKQGDTNNTQVYVKDGNLVFKSCPGKGWFGWNSSCPSGYNLDVEITTPGFASVEIDGSGKIDARAGFPQQPKIEIEINGSGNVDLMNVPAASTDVAIHGSGKVHVNAQQKLDVEIAGSGSVVYGGNPHISQTIMGSGEVKSAR
ncbi:MAG: GIN domain-containing protein [Rhizomicrobium sp.]